MISTDGTADIAGAEHAAVHTMATIAAELLAGLPVEQQGRAALTPFQDPAVDAERKRWYYTPTDHGGVALSEMTVRQQSLAMQLLAAGVSRAAFVTICAVVGLENILDELEGWHVDWGRKRGRDPGLYWVRIFGKPGDPTWAWRFGGHHVSVNVLINEHRVVSATPFFIGTDPARSPLLGGELRPLGPTEDLARELVVSLDREQRKQAVLHTRAISDIVSGNRAAVTQGDQMIHMQHLFRGHLQDPRLASLIDLIDERAEAGSGYTELDHRRMALGATPAGLSSADMSSGQRDVLRKLIATYTDRAPAVFQGGLSSNQLGEVSFGWAGDIQPGRPHYYRLSGPCLLAEYDNTQRDANHAHSVWRDPLRDFGIVRSP